MNGQGPRVPDINYPPIIYDKVTIGYPMDIDEKECQIATSTLVELIVLALRDLKDRSGSTIADIRRVLVSKGHRASFVNVRDALIVALKEKKIQRPLKAEMSGIYGRYVLVDDGASLKK